MKNRFPQIDITFACSHDKASIVRERGYKIEEIFVQSASTVYERIAQLKPMYSLEDAQRYVAEDIRVINKVQPDLIVYDWRLSLPIAAQKVRTNFVALTCGIWSGFYCGRRSVPFQISKTIPLPTKMLSLIYNSALGRYLEQKSFEKHALPFNKVSKQHGLEPLGAYEKYAASGNRVLVADDPSLIKLSTVPNNFTIVGPLLWNVLDPLPEEIRSLPCDRKTIYFTLGTSAFPNEKAPALMRAILERGYRLIMTVAGDTKIREAIKHPNLFIYDFLPSKKLAKQCDLIISHGGIATSYEAFLEGIPVLGIPSIPDQQWHMDAVEDAGAGLTAFPHQLDIVTVMEKVELLLHNPKFANNARKIGDSIRCFKTEDLILEALSLQEI